jgi:hypothetical protein
VTLSAAVNRHHTAWIHWDAGESHPVRYAVDGDRVVFFGDGLPSGADGHRATVTVHEIAGGHQVAEFSGPLRLVGADEVDANAVLDLLEHVSLGRTPAERNASLAHHRTRPLFTVSDASQAVSR